MNKYYNITFTEIQIQNAIKRIMSFEKKLGFQLPDEYKNFLLEFDSLCEYSSDLGDDITLSQIRLGYPKGWIFIKEGLGSISFTNIYGLYNKYSSCFRLDMVIQYVEAARFPSHTLAIGDNGCSDFILISYGDENNGKLYIWDHETQFENDNTSFICNSFKEFMEGLMEPKM
jgi:hypothetical protein